MPVEGVSLYSPASFGDSQGLEKSKSHIVIPDASVCHVEVKVQRGSLGPVVCSGSGQQVWKVFIGPNARPGPGTQVLCPPSFRSQGPPPFEAFLTLSCVASLHSTPCCVFQVDLHPTEMTFSSMCYPECGVARPSPISVSCNEPCVRQCPDSHVTIIPTPVDVTLPGPILETHPQQSTVGAVEDPALGVGYGSSLGLGGLGDNGGFYGLRKFGGFRGYLGGYRYGRYCGYPGYYGYGGYCGYPGYYGYGRYCGYPGFYGSRRLYGSGVSCHSYLGGYCGPC
uniref:Keratin n=1 Tax=Pelodiscus sinensis TaxID=13735 RepID=K7GAJ0_PELSI